MHVLGSCRLLYPLFEHGDECDCVLVICVVSPHMLACCVAISPTETPETERQDQLSNRSKTNGERCEIMLPQAREVMTLL